MHGAHASSSTNVPPVRNAHAVHAWRKRHTPPIGRTHINTIAIWSYPSAEVRVKNKRRLRTSAREMLEPAAMPPVDSNRFLNTNVEHVAASRLLLCTIPPWNYIHKCTTCCHLCLMMCYHLFDDVCMCFWRCVPCRLRLFTTCLTMRACFLRMFTTCFDDCLPLVWRCVQLLLTMFSTCVDELFIVLTNVYHLLLTTITIVFDELYHCVWRLLTVFDELYVLWRHLHLVWRLFTTCLNDAHHVFWQCLQHVLTMFYNLCDDVWSCVSYMLTI
jgi:hypothetical protein